MFGKKKVSLPKDIYERAVELSQKKGYPSVEEFVVHLIEKESRASGESSSTDSSSSELKGLGYL